MLEKVIERKFISLLKEIDCLCLKFESPGNTGVPDRVVVGHYGNIYFVEFKRSKNSKVSNKQKYWKEELTKRNLHSYIICSQEEMLVLFNQIQNEENKYRDIYGGELDD